MNPVKPKLLFHVCCAPCSGFLSTQLGEVFDLTVYYDNSNIFPREEFDRRSLEAKKFFESQNIDFVLAEWKHDKWLDLVRGLEGEPERGNRCVICYHFRLRNAAEYARQNGFDIFTTTLSVSPHKDSRLISEIGMALSQEYGIKFLNEDFKKNDGFKKAMEFAKELGFYRQNYCGCEFSQLQKQDKNVIL